MFQDGNIQTTNIDSFLADCSIDTLRIYKWEERVGVEREHHLSKSSPDLSRLAIHFMVYIVGFDFQHSPYSFSLNFISAKAVQISPGRQFLNQSFRTFIWNSLQSIINANLSSDLNFWNRVSLSNIILRSGDLRCSDLAGNIPPVICCFAQFLIFTTSLLVRPSQHFYLPILLS